MTTKQRIHLLAQLWPDACQAMGWRAGDRERRLEIISRALGRPVESANEIKTNKDFDAVKSALISISRPADLAAQIKMDNQPRLRLIKIIEEHPEAYVIEIARDKFRTPHSALRTSVDWRVDLNLSQLTQLLYTLTARAQARRHRQPADLREAEQIDPDLVPF